MRSEDSNSERQDLKAILAQVRDAVSPTRIDQIAQQFERPVETARALAHLMGQPEYSQECYQLLTRLDVADVIPDLERLLDATDEKVRHCATLTLADMASAPKSPQLKQALKRWLGDVAYPVTNEEDALENMRVIERLARVGELGSDAADRLEAVLFFIPQGPYREFFWPRVWIKASRLLNEFGFIDNLKKVANSEARHYLSAAGAVALSVNGFMEGSVEEWLRNSRDYYLLNSEERRELDRILSQLGDAEQELAKLRSVNATSGNEVVR